MLLSEDHRAVQDAVRAYVQAEVAPFAAAWDKSHQFPRDALRGVAALGCYGVAVPTAWDGAGLDYLALALILEEVAAGDGATSTVLSVNNCPVCSILMAFGNNDQKERFLKPLARGDMLGAFCLTEPHVGSEAGGLKTTATRARDGDGDGDSYVLNGVKQFITSGKNGDIAIVMAVLNYNPHHCTTTDLAPYRSSLLQPRTRHDHTAHSQEAFYDYASLCLQSGSTAEDSSGNRN